MGSKASCGTATIGSRGETFEYKPTPLMAPTSHYDKQKADIAVQFIQLLCHTKGKWYKRPFEMQPWQEQIIRDLYGIVREDGKRQFSTAFVEVPKKNGKSELAAAIALKQLCCDGEQRAEVYGCAADHNQASIVFDVAADMVSLNKYLSKNIRIYKATKEMVYLPTNSKYKVLSADAETKHGFNVSAVVFDELHTQPNRKLYDVMTTGSGDAREQPLFFLITTAGDNVNSICYEVHQKAVDILQGRKHDETFYPVIFGADREDDWTDEAVWYKANPSLGITVDVEKVRAACKAAQEDPAAENAFRQLRLNQWVKQAVRWMPMEKWHACRGEVDAEALKGRPCYGGLDLSSTQDITAFVLVFPPMQDGERYAVLSWFWIPEDCLQFRVRRDHVPYDIWKQKGYLFTTEGDVIHYASIEQFIFMLWQDYDIREIAFDRWGATQVSQDMDAEGLTMVQFGQGFRDMSPPTKELMRMVLAREIVHGGNPVLDWMMDNIFIRKDPAGNIKPDKEKSTEKIDGVVAMIMALDRAIKSAAALPEYNGDDLFFI